MPFFPFPDWRRLQSFLDNVVRSRRKQGRQKKLPVSFRPRLEVLEDRLTPTTINVGTYTDAALRAAITTAIADSAGNNPVNIDFIAGPGTILLTGGVLDLNEGNGTGLITVNATNEYLAVNAQDNSAVFEVDSGSQVAINSLAIEDGYATDGGGIYNAGTLTVNNSTVSGNTALADRSSPGPIISPTLSAARPSVARNSTPLPIPPVPSATRWQTARRLPAAPS